MDGMINIYKEKDFTSHDVVAKLRGILHMKKIGHTGTLDPQAEGVLPVCLGKGTKLCDMLADHSKEYRAVLQLGVMTDTEDMTGTVLKQSEVTVTNEQVEQTIMSFVGNYNQVPPMYSALKVNGKKLYELAREGKVIERKPRQVYIHNITIDKMALPYVTMTINCSKGTYIRSLCRDIGEALGCFGAMKELLRTRVGEFTLDSALRLSQIEEAVRNDTILQYIHPVDEAFVQMPELIVESEYNKKVDNGNCFVSKKQYADKQCVRIYKEDGMFIGLYQYEQASGYLKPFQLFFVEGR